jgi:signal transduction histidine kinase
LRELRVGLHWLFSALALGGGACLAVYAYDVWRRRRAVAGVALAVALATAGWWGLAYAIELAETKLSTRLLWGDLKWIGVALLPPAWFAFIMQFSGHGRWVNRRVMAALLVPPLAVLALLAIPSTHDLVRYYPASARSDPSNAIAQVGWAFWPFLIYADAIFVGTTALFAWTLTRLSRLYWRQSALLIVTVLLPFLANILHNLNVEPFARVELTPFLFVLTGAVLVWGIFRFRLLDLAPIARGRIFQLMHDPVVVLDPYGRVVDANLEAARLFNQPVARAVGQQLERLVPALGNAITPAWAVGDLHRDQATIGGRAYELTVSALPDQSGRPSGALVIARDVSERQEAERHVRESLAREQAAGERLRDALEREQAAAERLRALDEMKGAFLQAVSHDMRTPLTSVLGLTLTLRRGHQLLPVAEVADLLGRLEGNARKLDRLLSNLLDLDRLVRGALRLDRRRVDLGELVGRVVKESEQELLGERPVDLEISPVLIAVDPTKVERIVENLLANTARHTEAGTQVWVRVEAGDNGALLLVEDAGPGVPAGSRETIFEAFQQGPSITAHAPGSGIGLALVAHFARMHGGRAWVEDRHGGGASFRVLLHDATDPGAPAPG